MRGCCGSRGRDDPRYCLRGKPERGRQADKFASLETRSADMKALCWHATGDIRLDNVADPKIVDPGDALIRITSTAICGSDLHLYDGFMPTMQAGDVLGHEPMGVVVEVGKGVKKLKP